jgi:hypothetical protein
VSHAYLYCQNHVQRLRIFVQATDVSGSRGLAPGILRSLLCPICSNPRRNFVSPPVLGWQPLSVRLCESEPCQTYPVKSREQHGFGEVPAKIAAFQGQALSRIHTILNTTASWLGVRTGTFPPLSFHGPPLQPCSPHPARRATFSHAKSAGEGEESWAFSRFFQREKVADRPDEGPRVPSPQQKTATLSDRGSNSAEAGPRSVSGLFGLEVTG